MHEAKLASRFVIQEVLYQPLGKVYRVKIICVLKKSFAEQLTVALGIHLAWLDLKRMRIWIMRRMIESRVDFVAFDLKHRVIGRTVGVKLRGEEFVVAHGVERLGIRSAVDHIVDVTLIHRHDRFGGVESACVAIRRLVNVSHISCRVIILRDFQKRCIFRRSTSKNIAHRTRCTAHNIFLVRLELHPFLKVLALLAIALFQNPIQVNIVEYLLPYQAVVYELALIEPHRNFLFGICRFIGAMDQVAHGAVVDR